MVKSASLALMMGFLCACSSSAQKDPNVPSATSDPQAAEDPKAKDRRQRFGHCAWLDHENVIWGAVSKGSAFLAGGSGAGTLGTVLGQDDKNADKTAPAILAGVTVTAGVVAAVAGFVQDTYSTQARRDGCEDVLRQGERGELGLAQSKPAADATPKKEAPTTPEAPPANPSPVGGGAVTPKQEKTIGPPKAAGKDASPPKADNKDGGS